MRRRVGLALGVAFLVEALLGLLVVLPGQAATTVTGQLVVIHGDDFDRHRTVVHDTVIDTGTKLVKVALPRPHGGRGRVTVTGPMEDGTLTAKQVRTLPGPVAASALRQVAVLLVNFTDNRTQTWTTAEWRTAMFDSASSVRAYYQAVSDGQLVIAGDVFGWYELPIAGAGCDHSGYRNAANTAAAAAGVNLAGYQSVVYAFPKVTACTWGGLAQMPGSSAWINGYLSTSVVAHEIGHNLGMAHASSLTCTAGGPVPLSDSCTTTEAGDPWDLMGSGSMRYLSNWHRAQMGWLTDTTTITQSGRYTLMPAEGTAGPRTLRIARQDGTYLWLEQRRNTPTFDVFDPSWPIVQGVLVRRAPVPPPTGTKPGLVDCTPATGTWWDAACPVGSTFADQHGLGASGATITVVSVGPSGAVVDVVIAGPPPPTTTTSTSTTTTSSTTTTTTTVPPGTASYVRTIGSATRSQSGNGSLTIPVTAAVAAGRRIVVAATISTFGGAVTCADSRGNVYGIDARTSTNNLVVCSAGAAFPLAVGQTITVTYPAFSGTSAGQAHELAGVSNAITVSKGSSTSTRTVSVSPAISGPGIRFAAVGGQALTPATSFTPTGTGSGLSTAYMIGGPTVSVIGTVSSGAWRALLVRYPAS